MKKVKSNNENCIPILTSCIEWNGGSIEYLGICDGDSLNQLLWEVITKLQEIAGEDLSEFDVDSLLDICNQKAPLEVDLLSILTILKNNQICLKEFIDTLEERLNELFQNTGVTVNLKCYAEFDNLGNSLSITRESLDQLIIDRLCEHKQRLDTIEGKIITMQAEIDAIDPTASVEELSFDTCLDVGVDKPTSTNVTDLAEAHCDLEEATGTPADFSSAYAQTPTYTTAVTTDPDYIGVPANFAENYNNLLIAFSNLQARVTIMELTCCAIDCNDIELGFIAVYDAADNELVISFTWGAGTIIPAGFVDAGSYGTITDGEGSIVNFNLEVANNSTDSISLSGLNTATPLTVNITVILSNGSVTCQKCVTRTITSPACAYCTYTASGGSVSIFYSITEA